MGWECIWGAAGTVVADGETGAVYALPGSGARVPDAVYRWRGTPFDWEPLGGSAIALATAGWAPDSAVFGLDATRTVSRYDDQSAQWLAIGAPPGGAAAIYGGPDQLIAASVDNGDLYRWDPSAPPPAWRHIGGPAKKVAIGKSSDCEFRFQVYGQSPDTATQGRGVYRWLGGNWHQDGGPAGDILVTRAQLFATNPASGDLMMQTETGWKRIGGPGKQFAADHVGHVYGLSPDGQSVWRWSGSPKKWTQIGGPAAALFAGWDGQLFAVSPTTGDLWHYRAPVPAQSAVPDFAGQVPESRIRHVLGDRKVLVALWDPHRPAHPRPTRQAVESVIFGPRPSFADWITENSGGRARLVTAGVFGWFDAPPDKQGDHYWDNPDPNSPDAVKRSPTYHEDKYKDGWLSGHVEKWAAAILRAADDTDFAAHDADDDGRLDPSECAVFLCFPQNTSAGYWRDTVAGVQYPARKDLVVDGVEIPVVTEWYLGKSPHFPTGMHELAHLVLETPDMYFSSDWRYEAGAYSLSDRIYGQHISAPEKLKLGWLDYTVVTNDGTYSLTDVETTHKALILMTPGSGGSEYLVLENRWRGTTYDAGGAGIGPGLPSDGLAIWHVIDDAAIFNTADPWPPSTTPNEWGRLGVRLVRADGGATTDDAHALFDKAGSVISDVSQPARLRWLHDRPTGLRIKLLSDAGKTMQLQIGVSSPA